MATWQDRVQFFSPPRLSDAVHREECTQCFDNQDGPEGVDVCLSCFNGGCLGPERHHARTHFEKSKHPLSLNIKRIPKPKRNEEEPPLKKLAIQEEREEDNYTFQTTLRSWPDDGKLIPEASEHSKVATLIDGVMTSLSSARQSEVKAWEEEIVACEHTLTLHQSSSEHIKPSGLAHCSKCELNENLWLCLTCGSLGCGRQQFGGVGGNGHGLKHYEETKHPIAVKLGTITAEGTADIYCYECNDSKLDLELAAHLSNFGINVSQQTKTEKTITELQIEHNLKFDFSLTGEDGKLLQPVYGPELTGLRNLGNSCYMASTIQSIFSLPSFKQRYGVPSAAAEHAISCSEPVPANCIECQMFKVADGLLSGRYSHPRVIPQSAQNAEQADDPVFQEGIKPTGFKALIGKGHVEFATMKQQDAEEFFTHLLKVLRQDYKKRGTGGSDPTEVFRHGVEQRLQCLECRRVSYRVDSADVVSVPVPSRVKGKDEDGKTLYEDVDFMECLDGFTGSEALEYRCPSCNKNVTAVKQSKFATFPDVLVIHARKFQLVDWVPQKLDIPLRLPATNDIALDKYLGSGHQAGEELLPSEAAASPAAPAAPQFNEEALEQLQSMGFPLIRCQRALLATGNSDANAAMEWLFGHMDDPDIDAPLPTAAQAGVGAGPSSDPPAESIQMISEMGFTAKQAKKALKECNNDPERAIDWLFSHPDDQGDEDIPDAATSTSATATAPGGSSTLPAKYALKAFISHKGPSVHSGHYVAHVKQTDGSWVFFNDEKVVKADTESLDTLKPFAYLYVFERV
ncbi:ubiquitin carboxyl-terminal hydrolase 14 [Clavulina sp. PMI_390]|nr:ubiquitin carboxyl-terminal hydrolase 14 [Clavulina sp. PMI_390]